jgi:hypothetical protein
MTDEEFAELETCISDIDADNTRLVDIIDPGDFVEAGLYFANIINRARRGIELILTEVKRASK